MSVFMHALALLPAVVVVVVVVAALADRRDASALNGLRALDSMGHVETPRIHRRTDGASNPEAGRARSCFSQQPLQILIRRQKEPEILPRDVELAVPSSRVDLRVFLGNLLVGG